MRRTELLIGAGALVVASISITLYLVNSPLRPQRSSHVITVPQEEPEQILSPQDLLGDPSARTDAPPGSDTADGIKIDFTDADTTPTDQRHLSHRPITLYPAWSPGAARVEEARAVTDAGGFIQPRWSPVGLDIVFTDSDRHGLLVTGAAPTTDIRTLVPDPGAGKRYTWNADGMSLLVQGPDDQMEEVLITGERYPAQPPQPRVYEREERIYFSPNPGLGARETLISGPEDRYRDPILSPDETRVVYEGAETGLYIASVDGTRVVSIGHGSNPTWLPDSSGIVYQVSTSDGRELVDGDLWLAMADGSMRTNLTSTPGIVESHPHVAPDGERIAFSAAGTIYVGRLVRPELQASAKATPARQ